jgi:integrase
MKLTKKVVEGLPLPDSGQRFVWDDDVKGFGIRLTPTTRAYIVQGRVSGVNRRVTLGLLGVITLQEARKKATHELSSMLAGVDPVVEKKRAEAFSLTLRELAEKYIKDHRDLKPSSRADIEKHINTSFTDWAERPAVDITRERVAVRFRELSERSAAQANQAFRILRALLNYARAAYRPGDEPLLVENPVHILSDMKVWNRVPSRSGRIPTDKIGGAWNAIQDLRRAPDATRIAQTLADAVAFLLLTGARWSEMAGLTWDQVNLEEGWWYVPDPKNRIPITFPLSPVAMEILAGRPRVSKYVFPSRSKSESGYDKHIHEARGVLEKVSRAAGCRLIPHDLRRTFRAIAGECGIEFWKTKLLMGHKLSGDVTIAHYTETSDLRYLAQEVNTIADWIIRQAAIAASKNVIPMRSRTKEDAR